MPWVLQMLEVAFKKIIMVEMPNTDLGTQQGPMMAADGSVLPSSSGSHWLGVAFLCSIMAPSPRARPPVIPQPHPLDTYPLRQVPEDS